MWPSLFISHGSPMLVLQHEPASTFLRGLFTTFSKLPRAIVVASAHWETAEPVVLATTRPSTIHDFYGFPEELYALNYPATGDAALASRIQGLLGAAGISCSLDSQRGLDHGAWSPLMLMHPAADIPVLQISVQSQRDARWHYQIGQALAPLREDVLIIGSGNLTHNLREALGRHHATTPSWVTEFSQWIAEKIKTNDIDALLNWETAAPHAIKNHPTPEHFLPLFVALGAGGTLIHAHHLHDSVDLGVLAMDAYSFGNPA